MRPLRLFILLVAADFLAASANRSKSTRSSSSKSSSKETSPSRPPPSSPPTAPTPPPNPEPAPTQPKTTKPAEATNPAPSVEDGKSAGEEGLALASSITNTVGSALDLGTTIRKMQGDVSGTE